MVERQYENGRGLTASASSILRRCALEFLKMALREPAICITTASPAISVGISGKGDDGLNEPPDVFPVGWELLKGEENGAEQGTEHAMQDSTRTCSTTTPHRSQRGSLVSSERSTSKMKDRTYIGDLAETRRMSHFVLLVVSQPVRRETTRRPDEGLVPAGTAWIYHTVAAAGGGRGKSAQPANNGMWDCDSNSNSGADGSQQGSISHGPHEAAIWDSTQRRRLQHRLTS
ncbi:hypothetical protein BJV77DRAFT_1133022 [Russula vinacea]|nr:hypothetical protein BJV77DRAFT_1133022 [Russula vinacea]